MLHQSDMPDLNSRIVPLPVLELCREVVGCACQWLAKVRVTSLGLTMTFCEWSICRIWDLQFSQVPTVKPNNITSVYRKWPEAEGVSFFYIFFSIVYGLTRNKTGIVSEHNCSFFKLLEKGKKEQLCAETCSLTTKSAAPPGVMSLPILHSPYTLVSYTAPEEKTH